MPSDEANFTKKHMPRGIASENLSPSLSKKCIQRSRHWHLRIPSSALHLPLIWRTAWCVYFLVEESLCINWLQLVCQKCLEQDQIKLYTIYIPKTWNKQRKLSELPARLPRGRSNVPKLMPQICTFLPTSHGLSISAGFCRCKSFQPRNFEASC